MAHAVDTITPEEYLEMERRSETKHEYFNGEVFAMAGASKEHNRLTADMVRIVGNQLRRSPCEPFVNDMRVKISDTGLYTYPDVVIACDPEFEDSEVDTLVNPTVIIEVLSPSTELYDRTEKLRQYQHLSTLRDYVLIAQNRPRIDHYTRHEDGRWLLTTIEAPDETIMLESVNCTLRLGDVYERITFLERLPLR